MSAENPAVEATDAPEKKSKKKLIIMGVVGLLVVVAAAHFTILKPKAAAASTKPVAGKIMTIPTQTLNLSDGHLLQVGIALQLTTAADQPSIVALEPKIDNITLKVLSPYTYHQLLGAKDRDAAQRSLGVQIAALLNPPSSPAKVAAVKSAATKGTKKAKHAKKAAPTKSPAKSGSKASASPGPVATSVSGATEQQVLSTYFTTFLMQ